MLKIVIYQARKLATLLIEIIIIKIFQLLLFKKNPINLTMDYKTLSFKDVKEIIAQQHLQRFPYLKNFSKNPYSYLKGRYYMYCSFFLFIFCLGPK